MNQETSTAVTVSESKDDFMIDLQRAIVSAETTPEQRMQHLDVLERIMNKKSKMAFDIAMAEMQPELPIIGKDKKTDRSKYASYEAIMEEISGPLGKHGFSLSFKTDMQETKITIHGKLSHRDGHSESVSIVMPTDTSGSKNAVQAIGSTLSYGKRYCVSLLLNIATKDEDDDAVATGKTFINLEMEAKIQEWITACGGESARAPFLKYMKVENISDIAQADYQKAINFLREKFTGIKK